MTRKIDKEYMGKVAQLPCQLCNAPPPSTVHHIREGQGAAQRADNFLTVALCHSCHQGPNGVHGSKVMLKIMKVTELDLLAKTIKGVFKNEQ